MISVESTHQHSEKFVVSCEIQYDFYRFTPWPANRHSDATQTPLGRHSDATQTPLRRHSDATQTPGRPRTYTYSSTVLATEIRPPGRCVHFIATSISGLCDVSAPLRGSDFSCQHCRRLCHARHSMVSQNWPAENETYRKIAKLFADFGGFL